MKENKRRSMIKVRGGFSDTAGVSPSNTQMQYEDFDDKTRVFISNILFELLEDYFEGSNWTHYKENLYSSNPSNDFCKAMLSDVFGEKNRLDRGYTYHWRDVFKKHIDEVIEQTDIQHTLFQTKHLSPAVEYHCATYTYQISNCKCTKQYLKPRCTRLVLLLHLYAF